ncbi:sigma-70 family RNA polymerase sigma factor [Enterococcus sp. AZ109]|uniref:sigma-70 family RNA polymerase sigma factor n=1 Tax=Enterococcus sp. AZ109 TaxID=2774634 RepID=UPI003F225EB0
MDFTKLNSLIKQARKGDELAYEEIFNNYSGIIYSLMNKYFIRLFDTEDWMQEGRLALQDAIMNYEEQQKVTFGLYFKVLLENRIRAQLRRQEALKRKGEKDTITIETEGLEYYNPSLLYNEHFDDKLIIRETLEKVGLELSPFEAQVFEAYMKNTELMDISKELNKSYQSVLNGLGRVKRKIKKELYYSD